MGTQASVTIKKKGIKSEEVLVSIRSELDGFPQTLGKKVGSTLSERELVNGIPFTFAGEEPSLMANGVEDLAGQLVQQLWNDDKFSSVFMQSAQSSKAFLDYNYIFTFKNTDNPQKGCLDVLHSIEVYNNKGESLFSAQESNPTLMWSKYMEYCS